MMLLTLAFLSLAQGTSHVGLTADDACLESDTGACSLHALQVGLQSKSPRSDKVITIGLGAEAKAPASLAGGEASEFPDVQKVFQRAQRAMQDLLHWQPPAGRHGFHLMASASTVQMNPMLEIAEQTYPQPANMTMDAWIRQLRSFQMQDPANAAQEHQRQKSLIVGFIILTILPFLVVNIEKRSKSSQPFETRPQTSLKITQKELSEHSTTSSLWLSIGGVVCDVTDFLMLHPGGNEVLLQYGGQEAAEAFEEVGHSDFARKMLQEKAIGVLVDGNSSLQTTAGTSLLGRLFTREDGFNIHKLLGFSVLLHVAYRIYTKLSLQWDGGFQSSFLDLGLCWLTIVLQSTSYFFEVPRARLLGSPMIWQEWRAHNFVFVLRHVLGFTICWGYLRYVNYSNQLATTALDLSMFAVLYGQLYTVDIITAYIREDKHTSLTASWPFWDGCPIWLEKTIKWYYTIAQFQASTLLIMTGESLFAKYMVIFPFQFASFLMTLVRKGIITTKGFHAGYLWSLWMVVWLILECKVTDTIASCAVWIFLYFFRSNGLSKYALWLGPLVPQLLIYFHMLPPSPLLAFPTMMVTWLICMTIQKIVMGFATETRARRFLEARRKPLKLVAKEKVNGAFYLLKFEVPAGYTAGINPGQHVKVHVPNISKDQPTWNTHMNLEEPVQELSRSYTPVSATTSSTMDLMIRLYPKDPDRGFPDGGRASTFLIDELKVGQKMSLTGPHGHQLYFGQSKFLVGKNVITARACGALAGGSGITPVLSTLQDIWQEGRRDIRDRDQRIMGETTVRMDEFAVLHVTRKASEALPPSWYQPSKGSSDVTPIRVSHVVTSDTTKAEVPGAGKSWIGKLTVEKVQQSLPPPADDVVIFVCGPQGFNESLCRPMLQKLGYKNVVMKENQWKVDTWCCANWCYVDKECPSAIASLNPGMEGKLFWSDNVCADDPALMLQCPYQPQPNVSDSDTSCNCLGATMPSERITELGLDPATYANYGQQCGPHDADVCDKTYPGADHAMWCCTSWCWVAATCPTARASTVWQGHYWSSSNCSLNEEAISGCKYDSSCECRGQLPAGTFDGTDFAADYGSSCKAWDSVNCKGVWENVAGSGWSTSSDHEWCCDSWCYVNLTCPIAKQSWLGTGYYFSYETCDDGALTYNEAADTCDAVRRLSARRRGGSWGGSSSWSSSRRRAPPAPPTSPRRRAPSAPTAYSPRRRVATPSPPPAVRRRAPPPPVPTPLESRRRTTSMNGQSYTVSPRRRFPGDADLRRRRSIPDPPYGYANRPQMMNNYGGTMPQQTPYGYSGYNAVPAQKPVNVAMYAAGGAVAEAVVGAGAMYAYNNMYSDSWEVHRRRRFGDFRSQSFCVVTAPGERNGAFMGCEQCYRFYGYSMCPSANSCQTSGGCQYTTPQSFSRDELAATGFIPKAYTPPLRVTFTSITGTGIDTASICPPQTKAEADLAEAFNRTMSFKPELFLVLSKQDVLAANTSCEASTGVSCNPTCNIAHSMCISGGCLCQSGYCWNGQACVSDQASVNGGRGVSGIAVPESMAALLVLYILSHMF